MDSQVNRMPTKRTKSESYNKTEKCRQVWETSQPTVYLKIWWSMLKYSEKKKEKKKRFDILPLYFQEENNAIVPYLTTFTAIDIRLESFTRCTWMHHEVPVGTEGIYRTKRFKRTIDFHATVVRHSVSLVQR